MNFLQRRAQLTVAIACAGVSLLLLVAGQFVVRKHIWASETLAQIEPRHARLLGLRDAAPRLEQSLQDARAAVARLGYGPDRDVAQVGNALQQLARRGLEAAGMSVSSSQVLSARAEKGLDRVGVALQAEGSLPRLQLALAALQSESPVISIDGLVIQPAGRNAEDGSPVVSCRLTVAVLRFQS